MGYFSNGSEGRDYEDRYCSRCIHQNGADGTTGCHVWLAHLSYNYKNEGERDLLNILIQRTKDGLDNEECSMFVEGIARGVMKEMANAEPLIDVAHIMPAMREGAAQRLTATSLPPAP